MHKELKSDISNQPAANEQLHQCKRCATHFQDEMQLKIHACNYCQVEVANQSEGKFKGVGKIREGKIDPLIVGSKKQCNICKTTVRNKARLLFHVKKYHKNCIRCQSTFCSTHFNTEAEKQEHEANVHTEWKKCIYCGKIYSFQAILVSHIQTLHKEAIRCDFHKRCATFFFTLAEKEEHILQVHKAVKGKMRCVYCSKMYTNKALLRLHTKSIHAAVMIKCKFNRCGLFFLSQIDSDKHYQQVHQHLENFQCPKCGFITTEKYLLISHIRRNHKQKKVKCNECQGVFWSVMNLRRHLPCVHSKTRSCDHCGLEMHRLFLISHLKIEKCSICSIELPCVSVAKLHSKTCRAKTLQSV
jgi:ribosomal protein L37AE/L43A